MFSLVSRKFLAMRNITLYSVRVSKWQMAISLTLCTENVLTYLGGSKKAKTTLRNMYKDGP